MNLVIHGVHETDAEHDIEQVAEILGAGLHKDFDRHVSSMVRIGNFEENKVWPMRIVVKSLDGRNEILSRAKYLKMMRISRECLFHQILHGSSKRWTKN